MKGKIDTTKLNTLPERPELETAKYFAELGYDIVFIPTSNIPNIHTPDIKMAGHEWEIKSPIILHIFKLWKRTHVLTHSKHLNYFLSIGK